MVVVNFLVFVSEVVSIFLKILTWIIGGQKDTFDPPTQLLGGAGPGCSPKTTPMRLAAKLQTGVAPFGRATLPHMARLWPSYLMRHGPFLARLVCLNEKA